MIVLKTEMGAGRTVFREGTLCSWTASDLESQEMLPGNDTGRELDFPAGLEASESSGRRTRLGE